MGDPLCCLPLDDYRGRAGGPVPLTRVKTIVSMTTPRDFRAHQTSLPPAFVEFDMSAEGFGGLYLPSIAPQSPSGGAAIVGATLNSGMDNNVTGGIGSGQIMVPLSIASITYVLHKKTLKCCAVCHKLIWFVPLIQEIVYFPLKQDLPTQPGFVWINLVTLELIHIQFVC